MVKSRKAKSPMQIRRPSKALQIIYEDIKAGKLARSGKRVGRYICHDLGDLLVTGRITQEAYDLAKNHIRGLLAPRTTISGWLGLNHPEVWEAIIETCGTGSEAWYEYKAAWVADMIAYWKEQGL